MTLLTFLAGQLVGGCGSNAAASAEFIRSALAQQRACDSGEVTGVRWVRECQGGSRLPSSCEQPGTDARPECQEWGQERLRVSSASGAATAAGMLW